MFTVRQSALVAGFATLVAASPLGKRDLLPYDENVQIHESCNTTQRDMLERAMDDVYNITRFARDCKLLALLPFLLR